MWETMRGTETSVLRLQQLIKSRYGKGVKVLPMMQVSSDHLLNSFFNGSDLHIPIFVNQNYLGTAVVSDATDLSIDEKESMVETIRMVLEPSLYTKWLRRREENLTQVSKADFMPADNLVLFNDLERKYLDEDHQEENLNVRLISNLIHLHGKNDFLNKRVAYQIHELSNRWAFLPLQDLEVRTVADLVNLGAVTLFVDTVEMLSQTKQKLILDYLASPRSSEEPLIVTSSALPLSELKASQKVDAKLLEEMTYTCFEVDRSPLSGDKLKDVLEMMFFEQR
jgi:hypothetical protein